MRKLWAFITGMFCKEPQLGDGGHQRWNGIW